MCASRARFASEYLIRPVNDDEQYDIDLVYELSLGKHEVTQKVLKEMLGLEMFSQKPSFLI